MGRFSKFFDLTEEERRELIRKGREENNKKIEEKLNEFGIEFSKEEKEGWSTIYRFNLRGKDVFTNSFKRNGELELYYYSEEYSCKSCRMKINK